MRKAWGFKRAADLVTKDIRRAAESRGFGESRLLTDWPEVVGREVAAIARPVKVAYPRRGVGAVLTLLTSGATAPMLQMMLPQIRERVNATYGYAAISRIDVTQTAAAGFAEDQAGYSAPTRRSGGEPSDAILSEAAAMTEDIGDAKLKASLERLAANVISKREL